MERWREDRTRKPFTSSWLHNFEPTGVFLDPKLLVCKSLQQLTAGQVPCGADSEMGTSRLRFIRECLRISACLEKRRKGGTAEEEVCLWCSLNKGLSWPHQELWSWAGCSVLPQIGVSGPGLYIKHGPVMEWGCPREGGLTFSKTAQFRWEWLLERAFSEGLKRQHPQLLGK